jgi:hypothetical protein
VWAFGAVKRHALGKCSRIYFRRSTNGDAQSNEDLEAGEAKPDASSFPRCRLIVEESNPGAFG